MLLIFLLILFLCFIVSFTSNDRPRCQQEADGQLSPKQLVFTSHISVNKAHMTVLTVSTCVPGIILSRTHFLFTTSSLSTYKTCSYFRL